MTHITTSRWFISPPVQMTHITTSRWLISPPVQMTHITTSADDSYHHIQMTHITTSRWLKSPPPENSYHHLCRLLISPWVIWAKVLKEAVIWFWGGGDMGQTKWLPWLLVRAKNGTRKKSRGSLEMLREDFPLWMKDTWVYRVFHLSIQGYWSV